MELSIRNPNKSYDATPAGGCTVAAHDCELHGRVLVFGEGHGLPPCCGSTEVVHILTFVPPPH